MEGSAREMGLTNCHLLLRASAASEQSSVKGLKTENKQVQMDSRVDGCLFAIQIREETRWCFSTTSAGG